MFVFFFHDRFCPFVFCTLSFASRKYEPVNFAGSLNKVDALFIIYMYAAGILENKNIVNTALKKKLEIPWTFLLELSLIQKMLKYVNRFFCLVYFGFVHCFCNESCQIYVVLNIFEKLILKEYVPKFLLKFIQLFQYYLNN